MLGPPARLGVRVWGRQRRVGVRIVLEHRILHHVLLRARRHPRDTAAGHRRTLQRALVQLAPTLGVGAAGGARGRGTGAPIDLPHPLLAENKRGRCHGIKTIFTRASTII